MESKVLAMLIALSYFEVNLNICIDNIPVLTSVMHIISQLSYPFNETFYFFRLLFLTKNKLEDPDSGFGGPLASLIGISEKIECYLSIKPKNKPK